MKCYGEADDLRKQLRRRFEDEFSNCEDCTNTKLIKLSFLKGIVFGIVLGSKAFLSSNEEKLINEALAIADEVAK